MKNTRWLLLGLILSFALPDLTETAAEEPVVKMNVIPSWGDMALVYGPGTDPAMDTPQAMLNMMRHWKGRGFTGVFLRSDLQQFLPGSVVRHESGTQPSPTLAVAWHIIDEIMALADPHRTAARGSAQLDFDYWIFHPHIYSEGAPLNVGVPGIGRMIPWSYMRRYHQEHPEVITVDRDGNQQWMVPEYAYPAACADKVAEFAHMAKTYRPTGIIASMRSESSQLIDPPEHGDQYGFNQPVVEEMQRLYDINILTDPRFDWKNPGFNPQDPLVENWRVLRGSYITQLYREIRQAMQQAAPQVKFAVTLSGEHVGPIMGNAKLDWKTWVDEGLLDVILTPVFFEATLDLEAEKKGYLTHARVGKGSVSAETIKQYILQSKHPEIQVIQTGASSYFYDPPPLGADGWQCDAWYDAYHVAWYQRWSQWMQDLRDLGTIKFFDQNFDGFPVRNVGISGGFGDGRYHPGLRSCPGVWYPLGNGQTPLPFVQQEVRRGTTGNALAFTAKDVLAVHPSSPDRSLQTNLVDTAIANGEATFTFWLYRSHESNSLEAYLSGNAGYEKDVALRFEPRTGLISYFNAQSWTKTDLILPLNQWSRFTIIANLDTRTYSAEFGDDGQRICTGVPFAPANERFVAQNGVNVPIKVPSYRIFNALMFVPTSAVTTPIYLDDVSVTWVPTLHYSKPGSDTLLAETFEADPHGATHLKDSRLSLQSFSIEKSTSFGPGVHSARASGGGALVARLRPTSPPERITVDADLFIRSDKDFPYILPDPLTRSPHSTRIELSSGDQTIAAVDTTQGTWKLWNGTEYIDTGKQIEYDIWNHMQIAIDPRTETTRLIVQPVGALPVLIGEVSFGGKVTPNAPCILSIHPSETKQHISCYDNLTVTAE